VLGDNPHLRPWLGTFTVKNGPDLLERIKHLLQGFGRLWQRRKDFLRGKGPCTPFVGVEGSIASVEIKRGANSKLWHPHIHCLLLVPRSVWKSVAFGQAGRVLEYSVFNSMRDEWLNVTGDSDDVRFDELKTAADMDAAQPVVVEHLTVEFFELFKYLTKPGSLVPADVVHAWWVTQGMHLVRSHGLVRGLKVPEASSDDPLDGPSWAIFFKWLRGQYVRTGQIFIKDGE
jgi:hypothetical protein